jgi:hypothetical protein
MLFVLAIVCYGELISMTSLYFMMIVDLIPTGFHPELFAINIEYTSYILGLSAVTYVHYSGRESGGKNCS